MPNVAFLSRGLRGGLRNFKLAPLNCILSKGWSSFGAVAERRESDVFDAIVVASSPIRAIGGLVPDARKILTKAAKIDELRVQKVDEAMVVGNVRGLDLAKLANLAHRLDAELTGLKEAMAAQKAELDLVDSLQEERLNDLLHSHACYGDLRERYLAKFSAVHFKVRTKEDKEAIEEGNLAAHWGDAAFDATLYTPPNTRTDIHVFQTLYGVLPCDMEQISE